jgi:hypothetical protein
MGLICGCPGLTWRCCLFSSHCSAPLRGQNKSPFAAIFAIVFAILMPVMHGLDRIHRRRVMGLLYNVLAKIVGGFELQLEVRPPLSLALTGSFLRSRLMDETAKHYLEEARRQLRGHKRMGEGAMAQLGDEDFFVTIDRESNSIAVLVKHLVGNMRSRFTDFLTTDGEKPDRFRDREFEVTSSTTRAEVVKWWEDGWARVFAAIEPLQPEDVMRTVTIRDEPHTVLQAINRQIAHYAQHIGQIVFLAKHLRSSEWKTLSIPRGKSEEFKTHKVMSGKFDRGVPREK